jgi:hypothetical protein
MAHRSSTRRAIGPDLPERFDPAARGRNVAGARQASRRRLDARNYRRNGRADGRFRPRHFPARRAIRTPRSARASPPLDLRTCARGRKGLVRPAVDQVIAFEGEQEIGQIRSRYRNCTRRPQTRHQRGISRSKGGPIASRACQRCTRSPLLQLRSLIENGTPARRSLDAFTIYVSGGLRAPRPPVTSTTALRLGSTCSMRSRCAH